MIWYYLICFVLCAQCPDTIMQICVEHTCILVTSLFVVFDVWGMGSGKPAYITKPHGAPTTKKEIPGNEYWMMDARYVVSYKKLGHAWYSGTCAPCAICALALLRGAYWHVCCDAYFVQMRCYTLLDTFPWHNENACVRISADAYMPTYTSTKY